MTTNVDTDPASYGTSQLELLPDTDENDPRQECVDDEDDEDDDEPVVHQTPLSSSTVFLYFLSPYLRLGAIYASDVQGISLAYSLTGLVVAASLSVFCRQIWFLLRRYLHKSSTEDVLVYAFVHRHRRTNKHGLARYAFTVVGALSKILLAAMYLRDSVDSAQRLKVPEFIPSPSRLNISILSSIFVFVLSLPKSPASKPVIYTTSLSVVSYLAWLVALSRSYGTNQHWLPSSSHLQRGVLWNEISSYTFACSTSVTIPLSVSLVAATPFIPPTSRNARSRSFGSLNMLSAMLAVLFMSPIAIMAASPRAQASTTSSINTMLALRIATLVFSIPSVVVSTVSFQPHGSAQQFVHTDLMLSIITAAILALSLVPSTVASILDDVMLFLAVSGTFLLPALAHITIHYFRRPLSIVVPQAQPSVPSTPRSSEYSERSPSPSRDPLLQRKERLLQRRRFGKRFLWDIVVWIVLIPICGGALVWMIGRLRHQW